MNHSDCVPVLMLNKLFINELSHNFHTGNLDVNHVTSYFSKNAGLFLQKIFFDKNRKYPI